MTPLCPKCYGTGRVSTKTDPGTELVYVDSHDFGVYLCPICNGTGKNAGGNPCALA